MRHQEIDQHCNDIVVIETFQACIYGYRYPSLTRLDLSRAFLSLTKFGTYQKPWAMPALKELHLDDILLNGWWLKYIATSLTNLTQLTFAHCWLKEHDVADVEFIAADSVR